jgi:hypothetical protein
MSLAPLHSITYLKPAADILTPKEGHSDYGVQNNVAQNPNILELAPTDAKRMPAFKTSNLKLKSFKFSNFQTSPRSNSTMVLNENGDPLVTDNRRKTQTISSL